MDPDDKIIGVLMGLAVGNALGAPLEFSKSGAIRSTFGAITDYVDAEPLLGLKLFRWRTPGLYAVDAQLALALLDTTLERRGFDLEAAGGLFVALSRGDAQLPFGALRGAGRDLREAILNLKQQQPWHTAGHAASGGAPAARIAPLAVFFASKRHALPEIALQASMLTNRNPASVSAAAAVAFLAVELLGREALAQGDKKQLLLDTAAFCRSVEDYADERCPDSFEPEDKNRMRIFSELIAELASLPLGPQDKTADWIVRQAKRHATFEITRPTVDFAPASIVFAISSFMKHADSFEKALTATVSEGGDADTIGAVVGALGGALHGESGIPERWLKGLANRKQLRARALALASGRFTRSAIQDLHEMESALTLKEFEERQARMKKNRRFAASAEKKAMDKQPKSPAKQKAGKKQLRKLKKKRLWEKYLPPEL